jgi:hypothetical protein
MTTVTASAELVVWTIDEGGYLVRGTDDVALAQAAVQDWLMSPDRGWETLTKAEAQQVIDALAVRTDWFRTNPCHCGEGHCFDLGTVQGPGRGNFRAVYLWC